MVWYRNIAHHKSRDKRISNAKKAEAYSPEEIVDLFSRCNDDYERDYLIDRLYISGRCKKNKSRKSCEEYYVLTARQMKDDQHRSFISPLKDEYI